jgi:hypothetical protein
MFDRRDYEANCRAFNFSFEDSGFIVAENQDELNEVIHTFSVDEFSDNCKKIREYFNIVESGHSSEIICKRIADEYSKRVINKK